MSLTRLAMRIAAAKAIRDRTLAQDRVFDSAVDPIDQTILETHQPMVVVTTDEHSLDVTGRDLGSGPHECNLVIEIAIAARTEVQADDGAGGQITVTIPHTDEGMEITLDILEHQVIGALQRDNNDWTRLWMMLVPRVTKRLSRRGASTEDGIRFAARQIVLTCDLVDTPPSGAPVADETAWGRALTTMEADIDLAPIAGLLRSEIEGEPLTDWRRAAQELGVPLEVSDLIGIGPELMVADDSDDPQPLVQVDVPGAGVTATEE